MPVGFDGDDAAELIDAVPMILLWLDCDGRVTRVNAFCEQLTGRHRDDLSGRSFALTCVPERDRGRARDLFAATCAGDTTVVTVHAVVAHDGEREIEWRTRVLHDAEGGCAGVLAIGVDVTERVRAERAVREQARLLDRIFEHTLDLIAVLDRDFNFVRVSETYARAGERSMAELVGRNHFEIYPSDFQREAEEVREAKTPRRWTARPFVYADHPEWGVTYWDLSLVPMLDAGGEVELFLLTLKDVTEQVRAAAEIARTRDLLRRVVDSSPDWIVVKDLQHRYVLVNEAFARAQGREPEAMIGHLDTEVWPPELCDALHEEDRRVFAGGPVRVPTVRVTVDGASRIFDMYKGPLRDERGDVYGVLAYAHDVTAEREATEALRESEEELGRLNADLERRIAERTADLARANAALERADRAKDEFLASMSHELRTPLNAVLGLCEALREEVYGPVAQRQRWALSQVEESGRHLLALITDILDLSKIGAGRLSLDVRPVSVDDVCRASLRMIEEDAHKKRARITLRSGDGFATVVADERRLKQILVNLLSNAVKFMPEGGTAGVDVDSDEASRTVRITVWDQGIGISAEDQARIFQPFVQLDSGLARRHPGTGLGLALVRALAELMGGSVAVESEPGKGSRFTITLPRGDRSAAPVHAPLVSEPVTVGTRTARLLLAEDDDANASTVMDFLRSRGHEVVHARDGAEAVAFAHKARPDVILMDIQMPVMDGLQATRAIRESIDPDLRAVPIIALTALAMVGDRERCLAAGVSLYLAKPVGLKRLAATIEAVLDQRPVPGG